LGPVPPDALGITLPHEHLLLDARPSWREPGDERKRKLAFAPVTPDILHALRQDPYLNLDNCFLDDEDFSIKEAARFMEWGGNTIVDATCLGIGRDPPALQRISRATGLNIIMGTGFYLERAHPRVVGDSSPLQLTELIVSDLTVGENGIKAGYIGEIGVSKASQPRKKGGCAQRRGRRPPRTWR
jgi:phosphotriesterase-related protein